MPEQRSLLVRGFRVIRRSIATHPGPFAVAVAGATLYAGATVASAVVLGRVTDDVLIPAFRGGVSAGAVAGAALAILAIGLVRAGGVIARRYFATMTVSRLRVTLTGRLVERYQRLPLAFHRTRPTGELLAHAEADVQAATDVIGPLPWSLAVVLLVVLAGVALLVTDLFLALIGLSVLPTLAFLNHRFGRLAEPPARRAQELMSEVSSVAHESIDGALMVKTLGREGAEVKRLGEKARLLRDERVRLGSLRAAFEPAFEALPALGIALLVAVGSWRVSTGAITVGTLVQFVSLFQLLALPMRLIGYVLLDIPRSVVGTERVEGVLSHPVTPLPDRGGEQLSDGPIGLSVHSVAFSHEPGHVVLEDLSFDVEPDAALAVVGPTGSGKSTLLHLLARLADPDEGVVLLGGIDLRKMDPGALRRAASIVLQESFFFASSVRENITLDGAVSQEDVRWATGVAQADGFIQALPKGYDTILGERGATLSGGQRQRLALARALVRRPRLLLLDDATSAVDASVEAAILEELKREVQTTLVIVAHRPSALTLADRVLFLENGRISSQGTHEELLSHPAYRAFIEASQPAARMGTGG
jgi:ABC-type multidrug transport system fused ATPase/permease subunit